MALEHFVYLAKNRLPTPQQWQMALRMSRSALKMDLDFELDTFSGYLPCVWKKKSCGFEYIFEEIEQSTRADLEFELAPEWDAVVCFRHSTNPLDTMACCWAAASLALFSGGGLWAEDRDDLMVGETCTKWVRHQVKELERGLDKKTVEPTLDPQMEYSQILERLCGARIEKVEILGSSLILGNQNFSLVGHAWLLRTEGEEWDLTRVKQIQAEQLELMWTWDPDTNPLDQELEQIGLRLELAQAQEKIDLEGVSAFLSKETAAILQSITQTPKGLLLQLQGSVVYSIEIMHMQNITIALNYRQKGWSLGPDGIEPT